MPKGASLMRYSSGVGSILRSRATGLAFTVVETNGSQVRVRDENGKLINNWFDNEFFLQAKD